MKKKLSEKQKLISEIQGEVSDILSEVHCTCMCIEYDLARGKQPTKKELRKYVADIKSANRSIREYLRSLFQREEEEEFHEIPEISEVEIDLFLAHDYEDKEKDIDAYIEELASEYDIYPSEIPLRARVELYIIHRKTGKYIL